MELCISRKIKKVKAIKGIPGLFFENILWARNKIIQAGSESYIQKVFRTDLFIFSVFLD
jgi:hypothetical protein